MDKGAFGAVAYDFSDPTVAGAQFKTSLADDYAAPASKAYMKSALAGVMVPLDPKILQIQAAAIQQGYLADADTLAKVQADDPAGDWQPTSDMMHDDYYSDPQAGNYTLAPEYNSGIDKYRNYIIGGTVLLGGIALIWYLRK
jgi:hypothetical protein